MIVVNYFFDESEIQVANGIDKTTAMCKTMLFATKCQIADTIHTKLVNNQTYYEECPVKHEYINEPGLNLS